jgi:hypothetical protein
LFLLGVTVAFLVVWHPDRPVCRTGQCSSNQYEFLEWRKPDGDGVTVNASYYRCRCGTKYVARAGRFMEVDEHGNELPYMTTSKWGRWVIDHDPQEHCR